MIALHDGAMHASPCSILGDSHLLLMAASFPRCHTPPSSTTAMQYNHSKWRGHVLRVELAHPDFRARLQQEKDEEEAFNNEAGYEEAEEAEAAPGPSKKPLYFPIPGRKRKAR